MLTLTEIGNLFSRCGYKMPTIDKSIMNIEFPDMIDLIEFL